MNAESLRAMRERPTNPDAVDLTMRGWLAMGHHLPEDLKKAIGYFDQSLRLDPDDLDALVGKGICQLVLSWHFQIGDAQEVTRNVEHSMDHVLAANPKDPRAHMAKATISELRGQYDAALAQLNAAIESNPSFAEAYAEIGNVMVSLGRAEDAFKPIELALHLDPLSNERFVGINCVQSACAFSRVGPGNRMVREVGGVQPCTPLALFLPRRSLWLARAR